MLPKLEASFKDFGLIPLVLYTGGKNRFKKLREFPKVTSGRTGKRGWDCQTLEQEGQVPTCLSVAQSSLVAFVQNP